MSTIRITNETCIHEPFQLELGAEIKMNPFIIPLVGRIVVGDAHLIFVNDEISIQLDYHCIFLHAISKSDMFGPNVYCQFNGLVTNETNVQLELDRLEMDFEWNIIPTDSLQVHLLYDAISDGIRRFPEPDMMDNDEWITIDNVDEFIANEKQKVFCFFLV